MSRDKVDSTGTCCSEKGAEAGRKALILGPALLAVLLFGCAESPAPQTINASYVSSIPYQSWTCSQLRQEQSSLDAALATASAQQEQIRSDERVHSVVSMLVPLPPDTGSANITSQEEIAHVKGEQEAVRQATVHNSCPQDLPQTSASTRARMTAS